MSMFFFWIPAMQPGAAQNELNRFLASHRVLGIDRQFVVDGQCSAWVVAVDCWEGPGANENANGNKGPKIDYRDVLEPEIFAIFSTLRTKRKELSESEGIPAYAILTNEQMAAIARLRPISLEALKGIEGFGESRIRKYGSAIIDTVQSAVSSPKTTTEAAQKSKELNDAKKR